MGLFSYLFASDNKRSLMKIEKIIKVIEEIQPVYAAMKDEELQNQRPALLFAFVNSQTKEYYYGFGSVTTYDYEASHDDVMTKSLEIAGKGPITKADNFDANTLPTFE